MLSRVPVADELLTHTIDVRETDNNSHMQALNEKPTLDYCH